MDILLFQLTYISILKVYKGSSWNLKRRKKQDLENIKKNKIGNVTNKNWVLNDFSGNRF